MDLLYSLARIYKMHPIDFADLLLQGINSVIFVVKLFVSQSERTGFFNLAVSTKAFLSIQGSQMIVNSFSKKSSSSRFVVIPGGYFFVKALIPIISANFSAASQPASLLQTNTISSALYF